MNIFFQFDVLWNFWIGYYFLKYIYSQVILENMEYETLSEISNIFVYLRI